MIHISFTEQASSTNSTSKLFSGRVSFTLRGDIPVLADVDQCFLSPSTTNTIAVGLHRHKVQPFLHLYVLSSYRNNQQDATV